MANFDRGKPVTPPAGYTAAPTHRAEVDAVRAAAKAVADEAAEQKAKPNLSAQRVLLMRRLESAYAEAAFALARAVCGGVAGG